MSASKGGMPRSPQQFRRRALVARETLLRLGQARHDAFLDDRLEEGFLAVEIEIDGALRNAGALRDFFQARSREAAFGKDLQGGGHQFAGTGVLAALAGFGAGRGRHR